MHHPLNIVVIGTINRDTLILPDGEVRQSFGGILYNVLSLVHLLPTDATILPVCQVGEDHYETILSLCKPFPQIRLDHLHRDPAGTNENIITYTSADARTEKLTCRVSPLSLSEVQFSRSAEAILVNFISGSDISLEALNYLKTRRTGLLCVDVQWLSTGLREDGTKFFRPIPDWRKWLGQVDIVKLNENEIRTLSDGANLLEEPYPQIALKLIQQGVSVVLITLGSEGSQMVYRDVDNAIYLYTSRGVPLEKVVDPTGCGDVFISAFLAYYVKERDVLRANLFAHSAAALKAQKVGLAGVYKVGKARELMEEVYKEELKQIEQGYRGKRFISCITRRDGVYETHLFS